MSGPEHVVGRASVFSVGIDLERVDRFAGAAQNQRVRALFTKAELDCCMLSLLPQHCLAGTWCAKEAVVKALSPWARLEPRRVQVARTEDGLTSVSVSGLGDLVPRLSISVTIYDPGPLASAVAVVYSTD